MTSSKHIRLKGILRACPPHDGPTRTPSKHDEFLKRDRQLSLSDFNPRIGSKLAPRIQPDNQSPARTPPPTSLFLPMQLSNSTEPKLHGPKQSSEATRRQSQVEARIPCYCALTQSENDRKFSAPASQQGGVHPESSRNPLTWPPQKRPSSLGDADIGPCEISVNAHSQRKFSRCGTFCADTSFHVHFHAVAGA